MNRRFAATFFAGLVLLALGGCTQDGSASRVSCIDPYAPGETIIVPATRAWMDTGVNVIAGEPVSITAHGTIVPHPKRTISCEETCEVGPVGTFLFLDSDMRKQFPLAAAGQGPAPCYCLMARIGDGPPFFIGDKRSFTAEETGRIWLGINDDDFTDNSGQFYAQVSLPSGVQPAALQQIVNEEGGEGEPVRGCPVVVFYVDGLRPDVVQEMAAMGHIPNIRRHFVEGGCWLSNTFTVFPSDTITSNGTMWTGCFSDRHGIKGQVRFSRRKLASQSYLEPLGPNRSARLLAPQGIDRFVHQTRAAGVRLVQGPEKCAEWESTQTTGTPPLYSYLRKHGSDWATGILPMMTEVPPVLWTRSMMQHLPYFKSHQAWKYIDEANTDYARQYLLARRSPVTIIWLPETDSASHKLCRGQFGMTRRTIVEADRLIGETIAQLEAEGRLSSTYLMLVSDHGHVGGRESHLTHFDIANEFFFRPREMTKAGDWVGGGLGLSVRQHREWNLHTGAGKKEFVFIDANSDGAGRIFFPRGHYLSGDWSGPNRPGDLLAYRIAGHLPPVNLVESLLAIHTGDGDGVVHQPVDLVLMKLNDCSVLVSTADRGCAVIEREKDECGRWLYRYMVVENVRPSADGQASYDEVLDPRIDPFGLLDCVPANILRYALDEETWLRTTAHTRYPDSVVAIARHMLWQVNLHARELEYAPDLVVTARDGWYFGNESSPGTMHGYPLAESMRATWYISGPNVRRGATIETPSRLADLTPTILDIVGVPHAADAFDGRSRRVVFEPSQPDEVQLASMVPVGVYWRDIDLRAWRPLRYNPLPLYDHQPFTINRPDSPFDLNNIAYNVLSVGELGMLRLIDDATYPLHRRSQPTRRVIQNIERDRSRPGRAWVNEAAHALNVSGIALADYSTTSVGNLKRVDGIVDWTQNRSISLDKRIAQPLGRQQTPAARLVHGAIDEVQVGVWETYRFTQRLIIEVLDETVLNGIENTTDRAVNAFRSVPDEVIVE